VILEQTRFSLFELFNTSPVLSACVPAWRWIVRVIIEKLSGDRQRVLEQEATLGEEVSDDWDITLGSEYKEFKGENREMPISSVDPRV